jgi:hypothetical protein
MWSSATPWEKFIRTTSTPATISLSSTSAEVEAGPSVATILVALGMVFFQLITNKKLAVLPD